MKISQQFFRFCMVGTVGFMVDVAVVYSLGDVLGWYLARVISFLVAASTTWILNRNFTFKPPSITSPILPELPSGRLREYSKYMLSMLAGGGVNYGVYLAILHFLPAPHAPLIGVALGSIAGLAVNFLSARTLVFRAKTSQNW